MTRRKVAAVFAAVGALGAVALPAAVAGADAVVCNEAQSSWRGTWDATASADPLPPARNKDAAMPVGNGQGVVNAAEHSPALAVCEPAGGGGGGGGGGSVRRDLELQFALR